MNEKFIGEKYGVESTTLVDGCGLKGVGRGSANQQAGRNLDPEILLAVLDELETNPYHRIPAPPGRFPTHVSHF